MPLPVLSNRQEPSGADLLRLFHKTERLWAEHLAEAVELSGGVALANAELADVWNANRILEARVPPGSTADEVLHEASAHFAAAGTECRSWTLSPSATDEQVAPLIDRLTAAGYARQALEVLRLDGPPAGVVREAEGLTIVPARASYRHLRELGEEVARDWRCDRLADVPSLHLDDPHVEGILALKDGRAAGMAFVLAAGEIGRVDDVHVAAGLRGQGVGKTLMSRALESCARSLFRHVFLCVDPQNATAKGLYARMGFRPIGQIVSYVRRPLGTARQTT